MQKTFNAFEKATVKNSAKAVAHYQAKNETIDKKIKDLEAEKEMNNAYIEQYSKPVLEMTGYYPLELCEKVSRGSQNDWVFKYPNTVIPVVEQNEHLYEEEVTLKDTSIKVETEEEKKEEKEVQVEQPENLAQELDEQENKDVEKFYEENNITPETSTEELPDFGDTSAQSTVFDYDDDFFKPEEF